MDHTFLDLCLRINCLNSFFKTRKTIHAEEKDIFYSAVLKIISKRLIFWYDKKIPDYFSVAGAPCYENKTRSKVHRSVSIIWDQSCRRRLRFYSNLDYILFMGCKVKSTGFGGWIRYLTGFFAETGNCIVKTAGRYSMLITPCSICQATLSAFGYQIHPFVQGTPWSTFLTHNETSKCSKFLSPIKRSVVKIYLLSL